MKSIIVALFIAASVHAEMVVSVSWTNSSAHCTNMVVGASGDTTNVLGKVTSVVLDLHGGCMGSTTTNGVAITVAPAP